MVRRGYPDTGYGIYGCRGHWTLWVLAMVWRTVDTRLFVRYGLIWRCLYGDYGVVIVLWVSYNADFYICLLWVLRCCVPHLRRGCCWDTGCETRGWHGWRYGRSRVRYTVQLTLLWCDIQRYAKSRDRVRYTVEKGLLCYVSKPLRYIMQYVVRD